MTVWTSIEDQLQHMGFTQKTTRSQKFFAPAKIAAHANCMLKDKQWMPEDIVFPAPLSTYERRFKNKACACDNPMLMFKCPKAAPLGDGVYSDGSVFRRALDTYESAVTFAEQRRRCAGADKPRKFHTVKAFQSKLNDVFKFCHVFIHCNPFHDSPHQAFEAACKWYGRYLISPSGKMRSLAEMTRLMEIQGLMRWFTRKLEEYRLDPETTEIIDGTKTFQDEEFMMQFFKAYLIAHEKTEFFPEDPDSNDFLSSFQTYLRDEATIPTIRTNCSWVLEYELSPEYQDFEMRLLDDLHTSLDDLEAEKAEEKRAEESRKEEEEYRKRQQELKRQEELRKQAEADEALAKQAEADKALAQADEERQQEELKKQAEADEALAKQAEADKALAQADDSELEKKKLEEAKKAHEDQTSREAALKERQEEEERQKKLEADLAAAREKELAEKLAITKNRRKRTQEKISENLARMAGVSKQAPPKKKHVINVPSGIKSWLNLDQEELDRRMNVAIGHFNWLEFYGPQIGDSNFSPNKDWVESQLLMFKRVRDLVDTLIVDHAIKLKTMTSSLAAGSHCQMITPLAARVGPCFVFHPLDMNFQTIEDCLMKFLPVPWFLTYAHYMESVHEIFTSLPDNEKDLIHEEIVQLGITEEEKTILMLGFSRLDESINCKTSELEN